MNWVNISSGNGLSPLQRQAITWTNADLLLVGPLETNFSEIWIKIHVFSFIKIHTFEDGGQFVRGGGGGGVKNNMFFYKISNYIPDKWWKLIANHSWLIQMFMFKLLGHCICDLITVRYVFIYSSLCRMASERRTTEICKIILGLTDSSLWNIRTEIFWWNIYLQAFIPLYAMQFRIAEMLKHREGWCSLCPAYRYSEESNRKQLQE